MSSGCVRADLQYSHEAGPRHDDSEALCAAIKELSSKIGIQKRAGPIEHALVRAISSRVIYPFEKSAAKASADPALHSLSHSRTEQDCMEILENVQLVLRTAQDSTSESPGMSIMSVVADELALLPKQCASFLVLNGIWHDVFTAYSVGLTEWLTYGNVAVDLGDFFVRETDDIVTDEIRDMACGNQYVLDRRKLPSFISAQAADRIFFAGNVVQRMTRHRMVSDSKLPPDDADVVRGGNCVCPPKKCYMDGSQIYLAMEAASLEWRATAASELSQIMSYDEITLYMRSLREFLLLGNELFWFCFFRHFRRLAGHVCRPRMSSSEVQIAQGVLARVMEAAMLDSENASGVPCMLRLSIRPDGKLTPTFTVPFPTSAIVADAASAYSDIFAMAFRVRQVVLELQASYIPVSRVARTIIRPRAEQRLSDGRINERAQVLKTVALRMKMSVFMKALDDYLQADVFETGFRALCESLRSIEKLSDGSRFDRAVLAHNRAMAAWESQSLCKVDPVQRRMSDIFETCLQLCDVIEDLAVGRPVISFTLDRLDSCYNQNVQLLVRVLSGMKGKVDSSKIGALLMRIDWDGRYSRACTK